MYIHKSTQNHLILKIIILNCLLFLFYFILLYLFDSPIILFYILYIVHTLDMFYILTLYLYGSYGMLNKIKLN
jgi:hypothetical protein